MNFQVGITDAVTRSSQTGCLQISVWLALCAQRDESLVYSVTAVDKGGSWGHPILDYLPMTVAPDFEVAGGSHYGTHAPRHARLTVDLAVPRLGPLAQCHRVAGSALKRASPAGRGLAAEVKAGGSRSH